MSVLELREVSKTYRQDAVVVHALAAVSLTVQAGEMVAVMGPSGSGKSTLLADEPSGALDSVNAEEVMRLLHEACKRGVAAVVVTHDAQLASWADRVVFLRDGRVVDQTAPPAGPESLLAPGRSQ